jgi:hypothetical protein
MVGGAAALHRVGVGGGNVLPAADAFDVCATTAGADQQTIGVCGEGGADRELLPTIGALEIESILHHFSFEIGSLFGFYPQDPRSARRHR